MRFVATLGTCAVLASCAAAVPQPQPGGASGGSFITGMTRLIPVTDEYQVAWTIPPVSSSPRAVMVGSDDVVLRTSVLPERLFVADAPVRRGDGAVVVPQGTQLLLMDWPVLLVCSIGHAVGRSDGPRTSMCLLDDNGDGIPDSYFPGGDGLSGMWFVLNRRMPSERQPLQPVRLREAVPSELARKPVFTMRIAGWPTDRRGLRLRVDIDGRASFFHECAPAPAVCVAPPVFVTAPSRADGRVTLQGAGEGAKLRFRLSYGAVAGADLASVRVFFDPAATGPNR